MFILYTDRTIVYISALAGLKGTYQASVCMFILYTDRTIVYISALAGLKGTYQASLPDSASYILWCDSCNLLLRVSDLHVIFRLCRRQWKSWTLSLRMDQANHHWTPNFWQRLLNMLMPETNLWWWLLSLVSPDLENHSCLIWLSTSSPTWHGYAAATCTQTK